MADSVIGLRGTRVLSRAVLEHKIEPGIVPTQHRHTVEQTVWLRRLIYKAVMKYHVQVRFMSTCTYVRNIQVYT